ncbi:hypothetical protein LQZ19_08450 [Treponema primitia]|uniref:hypothetical protein n=1 Tax=Treponema primitia TaxID=88058 RepID=UPI0039806564
MIDIPIGKALIAVDIGCKGFCDECDILEIKTDRGDCPMLCEYWRRDDGKNVVFRLVDYPTSTAAKGG